MAKRRKGAAQAGKLRDSKRGLLLDRLGGAGWQAGSTESAAGARSLSPMTRSGAGADEWGTREGKCARAGPGQALRVGESATSLPDGVGDRPTLAGRPEQPTLSGARRLQRAGRPHGPTEAQGSRPAAHNPRPRDKICGPPGATPRDPSPGHGRTVARSTWTRWKWGCRIASTECHHPGLACLAHDLPQGTRARPALADSALRAFKDRVAFASRLLRPGVSHLCQLHRQSRALADSALTSLCRSSSRVASALSRRSVL